MKGQQSNSTPAHHPHTKKDQPVRPPTKLPSASKLRSGTTKVGGR